MPDQSAEASWEAICAEFEAEADVSRGRSFRSDALTIEGKVFAMFDDGRLVAKLPAERCNDLIGAGTAERYEAGGRQMREWIAMTRHLPAVWAGICREAMDFVRA